MNVMVIINFYPQIPSNSAGLSLEHISFDKNSINIVNRGKL